MAYLSPTIPFLTKPQSKILTFPKFNKLHNNAENTETYRNRSKIIISEEISTNTNK
jgi:hypothetical protein